MAKAINFNNIKKKYLTITLQDEKKTTILVGTPTKEIMDKLVSLQDIFNDPDSIDNDTIDNLYEICANIISRNKTNTRIDTETLAQLFDIEDLFIFFNGYMDFVGELNSEKN